MELKLFTEEEKLIQEKNNMMLIVPFVEYKEDSDEKIGTYTGFYNFDPNYIMSIEPDVDGDALITHRGGSSMTLAISIESFLGYLTHIRALDIFFLEDVEKKDKNIIKVFDRLGINLTTTNKVND